MILLLSNVPEPGMASTPIWGAPGTQIDLKQHPNRGEVKSPTPPPPPPRGLGHGARIV